MSQGYAMGRAGCRRRWRRTGDRTLSCQEHEPRDQRKEASSYQKTDAHQKRRNQSRMPQRASQASSVEGLREDSMSEKLRAATESRRGRGGKIWRGVGSAATVKKRDGRQGKEWIGG